MPATAMPAPPAAPPAPSRSEPRAGRAGLGGPAWPLVLLLAGYPAWWLLGVDSFLPLALAVPMLLQLRRRPTLLLPAGLGLWLLFCCWVVVGVVLLWTDAPGAIPGGGGSSRLLVFGFRLAWYVACGVVLVWVANLRREDLPDERARGLLAWLFVLCTAGGIVGLLWPEIEVTSLTESLLPAGLRNNAFVASLVHPQVANVQDVLGRPEPRPKAPFAFTNTWGSCLSLALVFLLALDRRRRRWLRLAVPLVLVVAAWPVAYSLNRGLWGSLAIGLVVLVVLRARRGDPKAATALVLATVVGIVALVASPLADVYGDRFENQHSNNRRSQLLITTTTSVSQASPIAGLGSTRDVQGSFASISGAATPECPACGVPPLGTQGQLWLVLFSQGWIGLGLFLAFLVAALARARRCRTTTEVTCAFVVLFLLIQLPVYDTLGMPLFLVMIAIGLLTREQAAAGDQRHRRIATPDLGRALRRGAPVVAATTVAGALIGTVLAAAPASAMHRAETRVLLTPAPVYLSTGNPDTPLDADGEADPPGEVTVDTEAALLLSEESLRRAAAATGQEVDTLREAVAVTAPPRSHVLRLTVDLPDAGDAELAAAAVAASYLDSRDAFLTQRRDDLVRSLTRQLAQLNPVLVMLRSQRAQILREIDYLETSRPSVGEVIGASAATSLPSKAEVPIASGAGLGLLAGVLLARRRRRA
ncbi:hypothetical protein [Nocardioides marmotae]|uniref:hypothetical protein n=1 Tax=Nocardioides marmotae TaxID=2663857 RepID=UPI0012B5544A|nr:hypothetical protein [Nocardioides marmotae]MBC9733458.1 hypothetical protein [Nocardioides marmotae]MTB84565.1 hypothetical protein [Nocardioides marmotae]